MLEVSSPDYSQLLDAYLKAADSFRLADKNYTREQDLYQHHAVAQRDLEQAESDRNQAQADLNAADQGMKILGIKNPAELAKNSTSAQIPVLAPISGEVVERLVSPGQVVQAGQTQAFTISDLSTVWVLANVYQADLALVRTGEDVVVQNDAYPGTFHGRIPYVSPALDPNTRTLQARIVVDNPAEKLKRDMYCTVIVTADSIKNAIAVPDASILRDENNQPFVYVAVGANQFGRREVEIGQSENGQTEIVKGIPLEKGLWATAACFFSLPIRCNTEARMIHHVVQFALRQRLLVLLLTIFIVIGGVISFDHMPVACLPGSLATHGGGDYLMARARSRGSRTSRHHPDRGRDEWRPEDGRHALHISLWVVRCHHDF
jgi:cobalt-zinc-cadmium efflux system membrane fusion protein